MKQLERISFTKELCDLFMIYGFNSDNERIIEILECFGLPDAHRLPRNMFKSFIMQNISKTMSKNMYESFCRIHFDIDKNKFLSIFSLSTDEDFFNAIRNIKKCYHKFRIVEEKLYRKQDYELLFTKNKISYSSNMSIKELHNFAIQIFNTQKEVERLLEMIYND